MPEEVYFNLSKEVVRRRQWGITTGVPQVLVNYIRVGNEPWRIKAWIDKEGHAVTSNFLVVRPRKDGVWTLNSLWALANSPFINGFVYCNGFERNNTAGTIRSIPVPRVMRLDIYRLDNLVSDFFELYEKPARFMTNDEEALREKKRRALLEIDAEVLRLYDLPPRLEKILLDFFAGDERKGVDFEFTRYYPENFGSYIPLRMYISEEFQNSTVEKVRKWVEETRSPSVIKALENAVKAFGRD